jgi:23S rRNA (adenine2503-C2)-methyltransferase
MTSLYDPTREEISAILEGEPSYRLNQLWSGLYTHFKKPADISNLPAALRTKIDAELPESLIEVQRSTSEDGDTVKFLWHLVEGNHPIETVLMYYDDRATSRLCNGMWILCNWTGRIQSPLVHWRDSGTSHS